MLRRSRPSLLLPALGLVLSGCTGGALDPGMTELGISEALAGHRAATLTEVAYLFELHVPAERDAPVTGRTEVTFDRIDPDDLPVILDFKNPAARVRSVAVDGTVVEWTAAEDHVVLDPEHFGGGARHTVTLEHEVGDEALNRNDEFLYTLFVPDRAHFSLPVFDQPDLKARVTWRLHLPQGWVGVGNGPTTSSPGIPAELAGSGVDGVGSGDDSVWVFTESEPIPTYLFAFAAGRFRVERALRDGREWTMLHRETDPETIERNRDEIFDLHARALAWLEEYTGIDYPFQKFDFVLIPPFQYGGMEHPGAVTYRQSSLMLDETATQAARLGRASLIAHETAHMWFGDLVTMRWFDDVWTKEVFANFMAAKIVEPAFPEVDHRLRFLTAHHPSAYGVDRTPGANPVRQPLDNLREAGTLYGAIIYQKAPIVMKQLERTVGEDTFRAGMREYLSTYAYGNATWPDLIRILDRLHPNDLSSWSRVWVEEPGRPRVTLTYDEDEGRVRLRQSDDWGRGRVWPQRFRLAGRFDGEWRITEVELEGGDALVEAWPVGVRPELLIPNGSGGEYGLLVVEPGWIDATMTALEGDAGERIEDDLLRGAAWVNAREWIREGAIAPERALEVAMAALPGEDTELVLRQILGTIGQVHPRLLPDSTAAMWAPRIEAQLATQLARAETRSRRSSLFSAWRSAASTPEALARLERIWAGDETVEGLPFSENDRIQMVTALALNGVDGTEALLDRMEEEIRNPDRLERFVWLRPALSGDPATREAFFASLAQVENREREPWVLAGLGYLHHPTRRAHAVQFTRPGLELLREIQATGDIFFPQRWLGALLGRHRDPEVYAQVMDFLQGDPDLPPRLRGKVLQSADGVRRAARSVYGADAAPEWSAWPEN